MEVIYIPQLLKAPQHSQSIPLDDFVPGLDILTPLRGTMVVTHRGTYLEVSVSAETIITLTCDRCLRQYNHRLVLNTSELIWLDENAQEAKTYPQEREIAWEDLSESLPPDGHFSPDSWLYEQLSLTMPLRRICDKNCPGPVIENAESKPLIDSRWAALEALKKD